MNNRPGVGIGVLIVNNEGKILVGKRIGSHAELYSIPGGHLENGETFEEAAGKEVFEETSIRIINPKVFCVTNNLETFKNESLHYISVCLLVREFIGQPKIMEAEKCECWEWVDPGNLPEPHFDASREAVKCYLRNEFYIKVKD